MRFAYFQTQQGKKSCATYLTFLALRKYCLFHFVREPELAKKSPWPEFLTQKAEEVAEYLKLPETMYCILASDDVHGSLVIAPPMVDPKTDAIIVGDPERYEVATRDEAWPIGIVDLESIETIVAFNPKVRTIITKISGDAPGE